jgi:hypothetical protein
MNTEQTFEYILDSRMNGNHKQARELFNNLTAFQRKDFFTWYGEFYESESEEYNELKTYLHKKL